MNSLSWMIYLADVCNNVGWLVWWVALILTLGMCLAVMVIVGSSLSAVEGDEDAKEANRAARQFAMRLALPTAGAFLLAGVIPAKETVYAIAASEVGEGVLKSSTGSKAVRALDAWLDKQIGESTTKEAPARESGG